TIDPQGVSFTYELTVEHQLFITLFDQDPKTSELTPWAASEVPTTANGDVAADGVTYTIKLKPDLKWSDGTPLTAKDFVYGIERGYNLNVSGSGYGGFITSIKGADVALKEDPKAADYVTKVNADLAGGVSAVDDHTLKLVSSTASASFLSNFTLAITAAAPQANVEAGANYGVSSTAAQMVTSGPYKVKEWVAKDHITIVPNDQYTAGHKPFLQQVKELFIADANQAYNSYTANQLDNPGQIPASQYPIIQKDSNLKDQVKQEEEFGTRWIAVDVTIPPWNNKDFVIGMNQATDRVTIGNDVYFGLREPWAAPCAKAVVACDPSAFSNLEFNLDKAKASIAKAYPNGNIPPVTLETVDDPTTKALCTTLQAQWKKVGVTVNIVTTDQKTL
ncbi:MAG: ABC transporter substrate-binding protein, partial [Gemmatimonadaceae bacterium]